MSNISEKVSLDIEKNWKVNGWYFVTWHWLYDENYNVKSWKKSVESMEMTLYHFLSEFNELL